MRTKSKPRNKPVAPKPIEAKANKPEIPNKILKDFLEEQCNFSQLKNISKMKGAFLWQKGNIQRYRINDIEYFVLPDDVECERLSIDILFSFFYAKQQKSKIACHCLHPGSIGTNIVPTHNIFSKGLNRIWQIIGPSPKRGAKTTLHLALAPRADIQSGLYWENAKPAKASNAANSEALQKTCWDQSNRMVGLI